MTLLHLVVFVWLVGVVLDLAAAHERRPAPRPAPAPPDDSQRRFSWRVEDPLAGPIHLDVAVNIRALAREDARSRLLEDRPGKVHHSSDKECFDVAEVEVLDAEAGSRSGEVAQVAEYLRRVADERLLSNYQFANLILSFVHEQCIPYSYDRDSTGYDDYFRFPIETVSDATGDCDCKAILAGALYKALGFDVALAMMPGHAALAITSDAALPFGNWRMNGKLWYYCEATGDCWVPGALPSSISAGDVKLREI